MLFVTFDFTILFLGNITHSSFTAKLPSDEN
jgi:hypothetical protein